MTKTSRWGVVRIRQEIINKINKFLESEKAKKLGYRNASQLLDVVLRDFLQNPNQTTLIQELDKIKGEFVTKSDINKIKISEEEEPLGVRIARQTMDKLEFREKLVKEEKLQKKEK